MILPCRVPAPRLTLVVLACVLAFAVPPLHGQGGVPAVTQAPASALTPAIRSEVIDAAVTGLAEAYVDADVGRTIGQGLQAKLKAGAYNQFTNPAQFAEAVTRDLRAVNGDLHLGLRFSPTPPAAGRPAFDPFRDAERQNFGFGRAEILEGNVGYLEITGFNGAKGYQEVAVDALRFLSRADAVIIDLRRNGGGSGETTHFVFSHFLGPTPVATIKVQSRSNPDGRVRQSLASVPGPRRPDVPLFLLTSQGTASAAEEFSFVLKNLKRATLVGTRTAGAGHMVASRPLGHGFSLSVSITRVSDPASGREWEQVGVQPDLAVAAERAVLEAHAAALRTVAAANTDAGRAVVLARLLEAAEARRQPTPVDARRLARFAGTYEGRVVSLVEGRLVYSRVAGALGTDLAPLAGDRFALGAARLRFEEQGRTVRLTIEQPDGTQVSFSRTGQAAAPTK